MCYIKVPTHREDSSKYLEGFNAVSIHIKYGCMMLIHVTVVDAVDGKYSENWVNDPFSKKKNIHVHVNISR